MASSALRTPECEWLFEKLARAAKRALLVEYDGILAPFRAERDQALPFSQIPELLSEIVRTGTRVVVISGRSLSDLVPLLQLSPSPEIWGCYGWERLGRDGKCESNPVSNGASKALEAVNAALSSCGLGEMLELKGGATAVHWRGVPKSRVQEVRTLVLRVWWRLEVSRWLALTDFDGGIEFRSRSMNKARAIGELLDEISPDTSVAYLGGSTTRSDDAFLLLKGRGLGVLVREEFRSTAAHLWLQPPEGVVDFLSNWRDSWERPAE